MFGTIAVVKPRPGQEQPLLDLFEQWWRERKPKVPGAVSSTIYRSVTNPSELMVAVVFDSKASYEENANDPEQDAWYREMVTLLDGEPRWMDGEILAHHS